MPFCRKKLQRLIVPYIFVSAFWAVPFSVYFFDLSMKDVFILIVYIDVYRAKKWRIAIG